MIQAWVIERSAEASDANQDSPVMDIAEQNKEFGKSKVRIRHICKCGIIIESSQPQEVGKRVLIELQDKRKIEAEILWSVDNLYGCRQMNKIEVGIRQSSEPAELCHQRHGVMHSLQRTELFSERFARLRRQRQFTLQQLASLLGVSKPTVWAWEKGKARPHVGRLEKIAQILDVSVEELFESEGKFKQGVEVIQSCRLQISETYGVPSSAVRISIDL